MLAIFHKAFAHPPEELKSPSSQKPKLPENTLRDFLSAHPSDACCVSFQDAAALAYVRPQASSFFHQTPRYVRN